MLPLSFECGIDTVSWNAELALRTRVSMSAMGSVIDMDGPCSFLVTVPMQHVPCGDLWAAHVRRGPITKSANVLLYGIRSPSGRSGVPAASGALLTGSRPDDWAVCPPPGTRDAVPRRGRPVRPGGEG